MLPGPAFTEIVYHMKDSEQRQLLQSHFDIFYQVLTENPFVPNAHFETLGTFKRCLSGSPDAFHNAILGVPEKECWDECIDAQLQFFQNENMPFVWYLNEDSSIEFKSKLTAKGFQEGGVFQGVIGFLDKDIPEPVVPEDCTLELVADQTTMDAFNLLVADTFEIRGVSCEMYKRALMDATQSPNYEMLHWVVKKQGKVVSALSTLIKDDVVSFWNGATLPEVRGQGLSTTLRHFALKDALEKGCKVGISYLMADGLAFGICSKLGYETKWRFNVFISPELSGAQ
ncbi:MAG: GNAT family N-acetyltransferase [Simkaniaceae bacterium]|nr:GNAT family N-acetyltransferase [Candidatus Sacchlamyda saccharinae]